MYHIYMFVDSFVAGRQHTLEHCEVSIILHCLAVYQAAAQGFATDEMQLGALSAPIC